MRQVRLLLVVFTVSFYSTTLLSAAPNMLDRSTDRQQAQKLFEQGNFAEALQIYTALLSDRGNDDAEQPTDYLQAVTCLNNLNRIQEYDVLFEQAIELHPGNWRLKLAAAGAINSDAIFHEGFLIGGEFERGYHRGGGTQVSCHSRDRVLAIRLLRDAVVLAKADAAATAKEKSDIWFIMGNLIADVRHHNSWLLQDLTDLESLPDYEPGQSRRGNGFSGGFRGGRRFGRFGRIASFGNSGAPVDDDGNPIFHRLPKSWDDATTDGERWRWALQQSAVEDPSRRSEVDLQWADFLKHEFGVVSLPSPQYGRTDDEADDAVEPQVWILHELADSETVAELAQGPRKISLPDEFNHLSVLKQIIDRNDMRKREALERLSQIRMNRHQYPQAAELLEQIMQLVKEPGEKQSYQEQIDQIRRNWFQFDPTESQVAGKGARLNIRYRNGQSIRFTAFPVKLESLLADAKTYLQSNPQQLDGEKLQIENIGYRLVTESGSRYLEPQIANWELALESPANHFDAITTVTTPLQKAGAYLLKGQMQDGNESRIVVWVADTAITRKRVEQGTLHFVSDTVTGKPIPNANIEFFGYRQERVGNTRQYKIGTQRFADRTDVDGICVPEVAPQSDRYQWITIVRTADGRLAYDGFKRFWAPEAIQPNLIAGIKVYAITDRPVYRPQHTVKYRMWVRQPRYHDPTALYANQKLVLQLRDPKNEIVFENPVTTDRWAGVDGEYELDDKATLGTYRLLIGTKQEVTKTRMQNGKPETYTESQFRQLGMGSFQVEEYRKPEFKVTVDAPDKPVKLGDKIQATVKAEYFFGAAVTEATVKYKVNRSSKDARWFPISRWDWLYSPGYWWFASDYDWYPGWNRWGCAAPFPSWGGWNADPPETVAEGEAEIGADGTFVIDIETSDALKDHGDSDHNYDISVEVVDQSRRTILGSGSVLVARAPFKVFVWPDKGFYSAGDTVELGIQARTPDGKGVPGKGTAKLLSVQYSDGKPTETEVESWDITTRDDGLANLKISVPKSGQYRISVTIEDAEGNSIEGGYVIFVRAPDQDGQDYRFNKLELTTEKRDYQPGETVRLLVNTEQSDSTVLLFVRAVNGVATRPQVLRLKGKSAEVEVKVVNSDTPNFFIEALTIANGKLHSQQKEVFVPPEEQIANVEVLPSSEKYRPGEEAVVKVKLTGLDGQPFVGDTVLSVYDASLESIAASRIPEIRSFFWNFRRRHSISNQTTLNFSTAAVSLPNEIQMMMLDQGEPVMFGYGGGGGFGGMVRPRAMQRGGIAMPMAMADGEMAMGEPLMAEASAEVAGLAMKTASSEAGGGQAGVAEPTTRTNFADTAYWIASTTSNAQGMIEVRFTVPDNLTTWKIKAWTLGDGTKVGSGTSDIISSKDLIIRPQTPRFFTETDQITLSAVVHNYLETAKSTKVVLEVEGGQLQIQANAEQNVTIPAGGEVRVDWDVGVVASGDAKVRMKALTDEESDATELTVPCHVHGILKTESFTGVIRPDANTASVNINVPAERIEELSRLELRYSPTLAGAMIDALPYLIEYPYGCTEQTLNRFLPAVVTQKTLIRMGVNLADIQKKRTNLNAQELGDAATRAQQWKRFDRNPVFDVKELQTIVTTGVTDLSNMQLTDGGWGWFSGYGERSSAHLTAQVVHGLTVAKNNDVPVLPDVIARGVEWLKKHQQEELAQLREGDWRKENSQQLDGRKLPYKDQASDLDAFVAFVLSESDAGDPAMNDYLYRDRAALSVYAKSLTGLVFDFQKDVVRRDMLLRNIEQLLVQDDENQTAWLQMAPNSWWYWHGSENEAMARFLQLLLKANPKSETAPRLVKYLLNNRKHGTYWNSTRDTAMVVEAMADFIAATGEDRPDMTIEILVDGRLQKKVQINSDNLFSFDNAMVLSGDAVKSGAHKIEIRRTGSGPVYFNAYITNFTKEDNITATGLEVKVQRRFYRLQPDETQTSVRGDQGQVVRQATSTYQRIPLESLANVSSGDLIEVELLVDSKNDYEYLLLEDRKPSGFETDDQRSGYFNTGLRAYRELRDDRVSFFLDNLARGNHSLTYRIRAESPSRKVSALPARIEGMYAPELVGNSDEFKLSVSDR